MSVRSAAAHSSKERVPFMDARITDTPYGDASRASGFVCHDDFPLCRIQLKEHDKLGNEIVEVLWCGSDYAIYRSDKGVYVLPGQHQPLRV